MAMPLVPSYNTKRMYGTWVTQGGSELRAGTWKVTVPVRVTNSTDDVIIPSGLYAQGTLNTTPGLPSLDTTVPCTDDPDNIPQGWQLHVEVTFTDAPAEKYVLNVPIAGGDINLRAVLLSQTLPVPKDVLVVGVAGGVAALDADGDVVDADGVKVTSGGGTALSSYSTQVAALADYPATFPPAGHTHTASQVSDSTTVGRSLLTAADAAAARTAIGAGTSSLALGTTSSTAKAGDYQPTAANISDSTTTGRALITAASATAAKTTLALAKGDVGLGNVDNTSDANKPVSTATQTALNAKATYLAVGVTGSGRILVANTPTPAGMQAGDVVIVVS